MSRDMQKHLFDLCMSQIVTILASEIQRSSFQLQSFLWFKVAPLMGWAGWLWTTLVVFIWQICMHNELVVFVFGKERLQWFKFVILEPCDYGNQFYLEKTLKIVQCHLIWWYTVQPWKRNRSFTFKNFFILSKYMFWLFNEWIFFFRDILLPKRTISSSNSSS